MNWNAGSRHPWPSQPFRIISGELLLVSNGALDFGLMRLERNVVYPGLPDAAGSTIGVSLEVIQESRLEISPDVDGQEGREWLEDQLGNSLVAQFQQCPVVINGSAERLRCTINSSNVTRFCSTPMNL